MARVRKCTSKFQHLKTISLQCWLSMTIFIVWRKIQMHLARTVKLLHGDLCLCGKELAGPLPAHVVLEEPLVDHVQPRLHLQQPELWT